MDNEYIFPDYFTQNAIAEIMLNGGKQSTNVYRVAKYGNNDDTAFLNYYEEISRGLKEPPKTDKRMQQLKDNIDQLSISCYEKYEDIEHYFNITLAPTHPERILLNGCTCPKFGLSQLTSIRKPNKNNSHIDWWLFEGAEPWKIFKVKI